VKTGGCLIYFRKILITTDLSEYSLAAMEYASSFGLLYSSTLYFLHVVDSREGHHVRTEEEAHRALGEFIKQRVPSDVKLVPVVRFGHPSDEIRKFAEEEGVDLVVIATHGRTGLRHIMMGSVAEKTVRHSSIPVLTVKPHPFRESILREEDVEKELHLR
jgi:nucleotide-binding universal stress UspA family protein